MMKLITQSCGYSRLNFDACTVHFCQQSCMYVVLVEIVDVVLVEIVDVCITLCSVVCECSLLVQRVTISVMYRVGQKICTF